MQETLGNILGFRIHSDGIYCKNTEEQVKIFQEQTGIISNGVVCNKLWSLIINSNHQKTTNLL